MEPLDLASHDPEEFEGKLVSYNDCDYRIGPYLGTGAEKIIHKLINRRSGLCLHVIKFWRDPRMAAYLPERTKIDGILYRGFSKTPPNIIPNFVEVRGHGGIYQIQHYVGPFEDKGTKSSRLWDRAEELMEHSQFAKAASLYQQILQINPFHTPALNNLAVSQEHLGDIHSAFNLAITVNKIEPNYFPYQRAYIYCAAQSGFIRISLEKFKEMKLQFVYQNSCDALAINLYLKSGSPERAKALLEESVLVKEPVIEQIEQENLKKATELALLAKTRAHSFFEQAGGLVQLERLDGVLKLLEKAYSIYDKDPLLNINLGLALSRAGGNLKRARNLLISAVHIVPVSLAKMCYANAAFNEIRSSNYKEALLLLDITMSQIIMESGGNEPSDIWVLPGIAIWIDHGHNEEYAIIEERINSALTLINSAIGHSKQVPTRVKHLIALYERAIREMEGLQ